VEEVLRHFQGEVIGHEAVLDRIAAGKTDSLYWVGGDPFSRPGDEAGAGGEAVLGKLRLLIVQDILPSTASALANYVLPGGAFVEKDGTVVNHAGLAQAIRRAVHGPGDAWPDGRILWELAGRRGLFHAANLRREIAEAVPALAALGVGDLGEQGVMLDGQQAAAGADPRQGVSGKREIVHQPTVQSPKK
jgi:predicted molibdopterin-dependent oxidoreductase YjgC